VLYEYILRLVVCSREQSRQKKCYYNDIR